MDTFILKIEKKWYAFACRNDCVYSIGNDCPKQSGCLWLARATDKGIQYVATPSPNRHAAYIKAARNGKYGGEWK